MATRPSGTPMIVPKTSAVAIHWYCIPPRSRVPKMVSNMSGVCSRGETRRITSNPMNPASTNMNSASIRFELLDIDPPVLGLGCERRQRQEFSHPRVHDLSAVCYQRFANNLIGHVQIQFLILDQVHQESRHIFGIHLAGVIRNTGGKIDRSNNPHSMLDDGLSSLC